MVFMRSSFVTAAVVVGSLQFVLGQDCPDRNTVLEGVDGVCMTEQYVALEGPGFNANDFSLQCTANDASATLTVGDFMDACTDESDTITVPATLEVDQNADEVFDVGLWVAQGSGVDDPVSALTDEVCDIYILPACVDLVDDGDACGDTGSNAITSIEVMLEVQCTGFETGELSAPYCFSWNQGNNNINNPVCDSTVDVRPGTTAKCTCDDDFKIAYCPTITFQDGAVETVCTPDPADGITVTIDLDMSDGVGQQTLVIVQEAGGLEVERIVADFDQPSVILFTGLDLEVTYSLIFGDETCSSTLSFTPECTCVQVGGACEIDQDCCMQQTDDDGVLGVCVENPFDPPETCCAFTATSKGDPHLVGFKGQKFDFTGTSGESYALLVDEPSTVLTMEVYAPIPELPVITYITGVGLTAADTDGAVHTIQIRVDEPADFFAHHECPTNEPCLAEGVLTVLLDGKPMTGPGVASLGPGVSVGAINIPGECRPFGFDNYWAEKVRQAELASARGGGRRLEGLLNDMERWITDDSSTTNAVECAEYAKRAVADDTLFTHQGEHASFQIVTPELSLRLNHGKLHQTAMRDPTDEYDLPDHRTYQMNMAIERAVLGHSAQGVLGGTMHFTRDVDGKAIMHGAEAFRGNEEDYLVSGPFDTDFAFNQEMTNVM